MTAGVEPIARPLAPGLRRLPALVAVGCAVTIAVGLAIEAAGGSLGTPLPPFFAEWSPELTGYAAIAVAALAGGVLAAPLLTRLAPLPFAAAVAGLTLALRLALAASADGASSWWAVFGDAPEAQNEYLPALAALDPGVGTFLDRFAEVAPSLPVHPSAHPPGLLVLLHSLGIETAEGMAALVIVAGALVAPLTYVLGRELLDESRARMAAILSCFAPSLLVYGATSADALFATLGLAAAATLVSARPAVRLAGVLMLVLASFFSYALLAVGAWATVVVWLREGARPALSLAAWCGGALVGGYTLLYATTGFDPVGTLEAAGDAYHLGIASARPYAYWLFGSPVAFLVAAGVPLAWLAARAAARREPAAVALAAVVAVAAVLGFSKAETERIWLFLVPLACVCAASVIPRERLTAVLGALAAQALAVELLLETVW